MKEGFELFRQRRYQEILDQLTETQAHGDQALVEIAGRVFYEVEAFEEAAKLLNESDDPWSRALGADAETRSGRNRIAADLAGVPRGPELWLSAQLLVRRSGRIGQTSAEPVERKLDDLDEYLEDSTEPEWELQIARVQLRRQLYRLTTGADARSSLLNATSEVLESALARRGEDKSDAYDRLLGAVPIVGQLEYQRGGFCHEAGMWLESDGAFERVMEITGGAHLAAAVAWLDTGRAIGLSAQELQSRVAKARSAVAASSFITEGVAYSPDRVEAMVAHHDAILHEWAEPGEALRILDRADKDRHNKSKLRKLPPAPRDSWLRIRCLTRLGRLDEAHDLIEHVRHELHLTPSFAPTTDRDGQAFTDPLEPARLATAAADLTRSQADHDQALSLCDAAIRLDDSFGPAVARKVSLLAAQNETDEAIKVATAFLEKDSVWAAADVAMELGRVYLARDEPDAADRRFHDVTANDNDWETRSTGWAGRIDVARRRRDLARCQELEQTASADLRIEGRPGQAPDKIIVSLAWAELQLGSHLRAETLFKRVTDKPGRDVSAWIGLVRVLRVLGRHQEALEKLDGLLDAPTPSTDDVAAKGHGPQRSVPSLAAEHPAWLQNERAWCLLDLHRNAEAADILDSLIRAGSTMASVYRGRIAACESDPDLREADQTLETAADRLAAGSSDLRDVRLAYVVLCLGRGEHEAAESMIRDLRVDLASRSPETQVRVEFALIDALLNARRVVDAEQSLDRLERRVRSSEDRERIKLLHARRLLMSHDYIGARETIAELQERRNPACASETLDIAQIVTEFEARDFAKAGQLLGPLPDEDLPSSSDVRKVLQAWTRLSTAELPSTPDEERKALICEAREILGRCDRSSVEEYHIEAILRLHLDDFTGGLQRIEHALALRPRHAPLLRDHALFLIRAGRLSAARESLRQAEKRDGSDARTALLQGIVEQEDGNTVESLACFKRATALDPHDYVHHRAYIMKLLSMSRTEDALAAAEAGLQSTVDMPVHMELLRARVLIRLADQAAPEVRPAILSQARANLETCDLHRQTSRTRSEVQTRIAYLSLRLGERRAARVAADTAKALDAGVPDLAVVEAALDERSHKPNVGHLLVGIGAAGLLVLTISAGLVEWRDTETAPMDLDWGLIYQAVLLLSGLVVLGLLLPHIRALNLIDVSIELIDPQPVTEVIHVDLDISASRLMLISGFSNFRPTMPFDDVSPLDRHPEKSGYLD